MVLAGGAAPVPCRAPMPAVLGGFAVVLLAMLLILGVGDRAQATTVTTADEAPKVDASTSVGALFASAGATTHTCTAGVVSTPGGNVLITAAHCVHGSGAGMVFTPSYVDGISPYGSWVVQRAYVAPGWGRSRDPADDYAFLVVAPSPSNTTSAAVQAVVGASRLGTAPPSRQTIDVAGYVTGAGDVAVVCSTTVYYTAVSPSFDCAGFAGGTSGSPWRTDQADGTSEIVGVIGGLHQGGCVAATSYSAVFDAQTAAVLLRAETTPIGDVVPAAGPDGC